jgi:hypothetical protein
MKIGEMSELAVFCDIQYGEQSHLFHNPLHACQTIGDLRRAIDKQLHSTVLSSVLVFDYNAKSLQDPDIISTLCYPEVTKHSPNPPAISARCPEARAIRLTGDLVSRILYFPEMVNILSAAIISCLLAQM